MRGALSRGAEEVVAVAVAWGKKRTRQKHSQALARVVKLRAVHVSAGPPLSAMDLSSGRRKKAQTRCDVWYDSKTPSVLASPQATRTDVGGGGRLS